MRILMSVKRSAHFFPPTNSRLYIHYVLVVDCRTDVLCSHLVGVLVLVFQFAILVCLHRLSTAIWAVAAKSMRLKTNEQQRNVARRRWEIGEAVGDKTTQVVGASSTSTESMCFQRKPRIIFFCIRQLLILFPACMSTCVPLARVEF